MRILGIDPGLNLTGYAVLEAGSRGPGVVEAGVIRGADGRSKADMAERLRILYEGIVEVVDQLKPGVLAVEQLYAHYDHPRTAILMAHARGVLLLAGGQRGLLVHSYAAILFHLASARHSLCELPAKRRVGFANERECQPIGLHPRGRLQRDPIASR